MTLPQAECESTVVDSSERAPKRQKIQSPQMTTAEPVSESKDVSFVARHPLGVRPAGNALTSTANLKTAAGTFARLPEELLFQLLETLEARDLLRLGGSCRALHAFTRSEELWRALFVE